ncbi:MAG: response regulator [Lachnospiraceae bacterium]|nr:response regulator [Lachnospiraceae bacterium]
MTDWVVVVDDDTTNLKIAGHILSKAKKRVTAVKSGQMLLDYIQGNEPDLILLDVRMPEMDGFEALERLRELEEKLGRSPLPVIFLTADDDPQVVARAREMGVADFIKKPFDPTEFVERIDRIIGEKHREDDDQPMMASVSSHPTEKEEGAQPLNLAILNAILEQRDASDSALQLDKEAFLHVYRFVTRYLIRYRKKACKLFLSLSPIGEQGEKEFAANCDRFCAYVKASLRKSDLVMQYEKNQVFVFLTDIREDAVTQVIGHILRSWNQKNANLISVSYEVEFMVSDELKKGTDEVPWIVVVDDDVSNLKLAGHVLSKNNMRVTALKSGKALLELLKDSRPNLILLDVKMPEMDGFETKAKLMEMEEDVAGIPVVFLTANDDMESERKGLELGAEDFVRKPFVPEILMMRVSRILEMVRLQKNLSHEVDKKTKENKNLFLHVVRCLADAIDAKDSYTNGHSGRVAEYSREIARRYGYDEQEQSDIYMMGLLHDVGKIGIRDEVINKPGKLTDEEYEEIKTHPVVGSKILSNIKEMPSLATGARWHHERFDGKGYPDGLVGEEIPEAARIIAVADAYDAMTSYRSYRDVIPQHVVKQEILACSGTQFDPKFANIMVSMMDEDAGYDLREKR